MIYFEMLYSFVYRIANLLITWLLYFWSIICLCNVCAALQWQGQVVIYFSKCILVKGKVSEKSLYFCHGVEYCCEMRALLASKVYLAWESTQRDLNWHQHKPL